MKSLSKYLNPKSQWHKAILPSTPNFYDYIIFFEENGFKELKYPNGTELFSYISYRSEKYNSPVFMFRDGLKDTKSVFDREQPSGKNSEWVRFCNRGKAGENNPVFFLRLTGDGSEVNEKMFSLGKKEVMSLYQSEPHSVYHKYSEFLEEAKKYF